MKEKAAAMVRMGKVPTAVDAGLGAKFANMVRRRQVIKEEIAALEAELGDKSKGLPGLNIDIEDMLVDADVTAVTCADYTVTRCNGQSVNLSREQIQVGLLEYGVPADDVTELVEAATKRSKYTYVQVTATKALASRADKMGFEVKAGPIKGKGGKKR